MNIVLTVAKSEVAARNTYKIKVRKKILAEKFAYVKRKDYFCIRNQQKGAVVQFG